MPTRNISLTPEQLQLRCAEDALKLEKLREAIQQGVAALERGDYEEVDDADLEAWLDRLVDPRS
jgi:antitoxin ParD1/3/4